MGKSSAPSTPVVQETALSKEQAKILKSREKFFQDFSLPALTAFFEEAQNFELSDEIRTPSFTDLLRGNAAEINQQFSFSQEQLGVGLAQRGLSGSGIEASSLAQLSAGREEALRGAASQAIQTQTASQNESIQIQNQNRLAELGVRQGALSNLLSLAPSPTTAAPTGQFTTPGGGGSGSQIGAILGGAAGGFFGGPAGIGAGSQIGGGIGGSF